MVADQLWDPHWATICEAVPPGKGTFPPKIIAKTSGVMRR